MLNKFYFLFVKVNKTRMFVQEVEKIGGGINKFFYTIWSRDLPEPHRWKNIKTPLLGKATMHP
jgi:hypothetical protein